MNDAIILSASLTDMANTDAISSNVHGRLFKMANISVWLTIPIFLPDLKDAIISAFGVNSFSSFLRAFSSTATAVLCATGLTAVLSCILSGAKVFASFAIFDTDSAESLIP